MFYLFSDRYDSYNRCVFLVNDVSGKLQNRTDRPGQKDRKVCPVTITNLSVRKRRTGTCIRAGALARKGGVHQEGGLFVYIKSGN